MSKSDDIKRKVFEGIKEKMKATQAKGEKQFNDISQYMTWAKYRIAKTEEDIQKMQNLLKEPGHFRSQRIGSQEVIDRHTKGKQLFEKEVAPLFSIISKQREDYLNLWREIEPALDGYTGTEEDEKKFATFHKKLVPITEKMQRNLNEFSVKADQLAELLLNSPENIANQQEEKIFKRKERLLSRFLVVVFGVFCFFLFWAYKTELNNFWNLVASGVTGLFTSLLTGWIFYQFVEEERKNLRELRDEEHRKTLTENIRQQGEMLQEILKQGKK